MYSISYYAPLHNFRVSKTLGKNMNSKFWILARIVPIALFTIEGYRFDPLREMIVVQPAICGVFTISAVLGAFAVSRMLKSEERKGKDKRSDLWISPFFESRSTFFFTGGLCFAGFSISYFISPESSPIIFGFFLSMTIGVLGGVGLFRKSKPQPNNSIEPIGASTADS